MITSTILVICAIGRTDGGKRAMSAFKALAKDLAQEYGTIVHVISHTKINVTRRGIA